MTVANTVQYDPPWTRLYKFHFHSNSYLDTLDLLDRPSRSLMGVMIVLD